MNADKYINNAVYVLTNNATIFHYIFERNTLSLLNLISKVKLLYIIMIR